MPRGIKKRTEEFMRLSPNRVGNQDRRRVRESRRQPGLRPTSVDATAFFSDLGRYRYGMKMKRQEKDRKKKQQPDEAASPSRAGFHVGTTHN
jgi:hypothetical protein